MSLKKKEVQASTKNAKLIDLRRMQLIKGAMKVFSKKGFGRSTVREIAEASGLTMGTMYNYIRHKEDILFIVYEYMSNLLTDGLKRAIEETTDPRERVRSALKHNMELLYEHRDVVMFLYRASGNYDRETVHVVLEQETLYIKIFEDLLRQHFAGRKINEHNLKLAADILSYLNVILVLRGWSLKKRYKSVDEVMEGILKFAEHSIEIVEDDEAGCAKCSRSKAYLVSPKRKGEGSGKTKQRKND
jgi:AcrR family transcriptional regulator